ncbi:MAG TPA: hypothetical protein VL689_20335 [Paraburkholderia sp.]|jgi:hypothetical protein|nr:hypothetical protein [Paraburkholderia sp.]
MELDMSISALASDNAATLSQSNPQSTSSDPAASNDGAGTAPSTASTTAQTPAASSSTQVTLSPEAQQLAKLNAEGVTVTVTSLSGLNLPSRSSGESFADYAQQLTQALKGFTPITPPTNGEGQYDGYISQSAFETVVAQFGGTKTQADQLFTELDANGGSSLSNTELLDTMAGTSTSPNSSSAQALLKLMDSNGDGSVSSGEFLNFETAMVAAEKPAS